MSLFDPLLVPLDGSALAARAAAVARAVARGTGDTTLLLHVVEPGGPGWGPDAEMGAMARADAMLAEEAAHFESPVDGRVVSGSPSDAITRAAVDFGAGLLVLTPRGRGALASVLLGSTSREVLVSCRAPMLLVQGEVRVGQAVVCGIDGGASAGNVLLAARTLAQALGARLHVVHVINTDPSVARHPERFGIDPARFAAARDAALARAFEGIRGELPADGVEAVRYGLVVEELGRYAEEVGAGVVVVGRRGESGNDVESFFSVAFGVATRGGGSALVV